MKVEVKQVGLAESGAELVALAQADDQHGREVLRPQQRELLEARLGLVRPRGRRLGLLHLDLHRPRVYGHLSVSSPAGPG
ncbi:MAG TPA: hypothetical protein VHH14_03505, partial [Solirubrobacterales bacterium]|nr:hypothetical protein [Solirubrobacterales bacterium]